VVENIGEFDSLPAEYVVDAHPGLSPTKW